MDLWFTEKQTPVHGITSKIKTALHHEKSTFQQVDVLETEQFGKMLLLDGMVMTTEEDEFVYHEMITHIGMNTHPHPEHVLIIGGGDGGAVREVLRYGEVKEVTLVEIDEKVIETSKKYFPNIASGLKDPRVNIQVKDGVQHIEENKEKYDVILIDSTEPIGPGEALFKESFYRGVKDALKKDGIMVAQTESPWFNQDLIKNVYKSIQTLYPICRLYTASIPTYPSGLWSFTVGSKKYDPLQIEEEDLKDLSTRYYHPHLHKAVFQLPVFIRELLRLDKE